MSLAKFLSSHANVLSALGDIASVLTGVIPLSPKDKETVGAAVSTIKTAAEEIPAVVSSVKAATSVKVDKNELKANVAAVAAELLPTVITAAVTEAVNAALGVKNAASTDGASK